jgi:hypothetical protein
MNCFEKYGITGEKGFISFSISASVKQIYKLKGTVPMHLDYDRVLIKVDDNIYIMINTKYNINYMIYNSKVYNYSAITEKFEDFFNNSLYYKAYNSSNDFYYNMKKIKNDNIPPDNIMSIINNIVKKILVKKNLTINIVLHGLPGSGKSSCVETISKLLNGPIYIVPMDDSLKNAITNLSEITKSVILVPELDKFLNSDKFNSEKEQLLLELLSGCYTPTNSIIAITCNDFKLLKQHSIMTRPGRVHFAIEFGNITKQIIAEIIEEYYPEFTEFSIFDKYVNKVTVAEFRTAIVNHFIMDKELDSTFEVTRMEYSKNTNRLYM